MSAAQADDPKEGEGLLPLAVLALVRKGHDEGLARYGDLGLSKTAFGAGVGRLAQVHWDRQGLPASPERVAAYVARAALADLYLASACEAGSAQAWRVLHAAFARRLEGFAVRRGLSSPQAESQVQDLFGDLASPPPRAAARTLLGTFDATGGLFGWLSIVLLRRIAGEARRRRPQSLDAQEPGLSESAQSPAGGAPPSAAPALLIQRQEAQAIQQALASAWETLRPQERFALVLKHRDQKSQREIGALLGLGEARVSRIVSAGVKRLGQAVETALADGEAPERGGAAWALLLDSLARHLASQGPQATPPSGRAAGTGRDVPGQPSQGDRGQS